MRVVVAASDKHLVSFQNAIAALGGKQANLAMVRAVNHTAKKARTQVVRAIARQSSIPYRIVRAQVRTRLAAPGGAPEAEIRASGRPVSLKHMGARQFGYGVKYKAWGKTQRMEGAFIWAGRLGSGKFVANGHVFLRSTSRSLPIEKQEGPAVAEEMIKDQSERVFKSLVETDLAARLRHEIGRLLPG